MLFLQNNVHGLTATVCSGLPSPLSWIMAMAVCLVSLPRPIPAMLSHAARALLLKYQPVVCRLCSKPPSGFPPYPA